MKMALFPAPPLIASLFWSYMLMLSLSGVLQEAEVKLG